jgi:cytoskeletal protein RodZ
MVFPFKLMSVRLEKLSVLKGFDDYEMAAGDLIRGERACRSLKIEDASLKTRIPVDILSEIENGVFSGRRPAYLMNNVVRDYAIFLDLDPTKIRVLYWSDVLKNAPGNFEVEPLDGTVTPVQQSSSQKFLAYFRFLRRLKF